MRGAYLDVNVDVPLLVIMEIDVWVALVGCHFRRVLLGVHATLHTRFDHRCQTIPATVVSLDHVTAKIAEKSMIPFSVKECRTHASIITAGRRVFTLQVCMRLLPKDI